MHADVAKPLHSTPRAIFPHFACIVKQLYQGSSSLSLSLPSLHCIILLDVVYFVISHLGVFIVCFVRVTHGGSSCTLCLHVWHSTFAVYHKNAIKIIIEAAFPRNRSNAACPVSCHLTSHVYLKAAHLSCSIQAYFCVSMWALQSEKYPPPPFSCWKTKAFPHKWDDRMCLLLLAGTSYNPPKILCSSSPTGMCRDHSVRTHTHTRGLLSDFYSSLAGWVQSIEMIGSSQSIKRQDLCKKVGMNRSGIVDSVLKDEVVHLVAQLSKEYSSPVLQSRT